MQVLMSEEGQRLKGRNFGMHVENKKQSESSSLFFATMANVSFFHGNFIHFEEIENYNFSNNIG